LNVVHAQIARVAEAAATLPDFEENPVALGLLANFDGFLGAAHGLVVDFLDDIASMQAGLR